MNALVEISADFYARSVPCKVPPVSRHGADARRETDAGAEHVIMRRLRETPVLHHEHQQRILRRYHRAAQDIDTVLAVTEITMSEVREIIEWIRKPDCRLSDVFHMDKRPQKTTREDVTNATRRDALKAKFSTLCEAYLAAREEIGQNDRVNAVDRIVRLFRALSLNNRTRDRLIQMALDTGGSPAATPQERSHAIMLRQALAETEEARRLIEESNQRLVLAIARKMLPRAPHMEISDLLAEGQWGLRRAIEKFAPDRENRFSTYAVWWIRQSMLRAIADQGDLIRVPAHIQERNRKEGTSKTTFVSLHEPLGDEDDKALVDMIPDDGSPCSEQSLLRKQTADALRTAVSALPERERLVVMCRFGIGREEADIGTLAARLGVSKERVRQIEREALRTLAKHRVIAELRGC